MSAPLLLMQWDGEALHPVGPARRRANESLIVGARYTVEPQEPRSEASHRHFFASVNDAWATLPEAAAERFASPEALRKFALIATGFRDERSIACSSKAEAERVASFIKPMDDFALVTVNDAVVTVWTAKSQSPKAMGKDQFQASKTAVLDYIAGLIGHTGDSLSKNTGVAA